MAQKAFVNVAGGTREVNKMYVNVGGVNRVVNKAYVNVGGVNRVWWPPDGSGVPPLEPGTYLLPPTALFLPVPGAGYAEFDTTEFRGRITAIYARISWTDIITLGTTTSVSGRPTGTGYRTITTDIAYLLSTVDHRIDTFNANALTEFNNGTAIGFGFSGGGINLGNAWSAVRLRITIS